MRPRFSLRTLFLITTALAAFCCYWFVLPSFQARRFVSAVRASDFVTADACFRNTDDQMLAKLHKEYWTFKLDAELEPCSFAEFLHGERRINFQLAFAGPRPLIARGGTITSTALGLQSLEVTTGGFGSYSM